MIPRAAELHLRLAKILSSPEAIKQPLQKKFSSDTKVLRPLLDVELQGAREGQARAEHANSREKALLLKGARSEIDRALQQLSDMVGGFVEDDGIIAARLADSSTKILYNMGLLRGLKQTG